LNVLEENIDFLSVLMTKWAPTHMYYFATPFIESGKNKVFSTKLFKNSVIFMLLDFKELLSN
jgi:hypothetical protein